MELNRWYINNLIIENTFSGVKLVAYTDVPCHLTMRWTLIPPNITRRVRSTRGLNTLGDYEYCFDVWHDNEQLEPGDTLIHTFIKEPWAICETRWFYFWGTVNTYYSPSTSPIFKYHRAEGIGDIIWENEPDDDLWQPYGSGYDRGRRFHPQTPMSITDVRIELKGFLPYPIPPKLEMRWWYCPPDGDPVGDPYAETSIITLGVSYGTSIMLTFHFDRFYISQANHYLMTIAPHPLAEPRGTHYVQARKGIATEEFYPEYHRYRIWQDGEWYYRWYWNFEYPIWMQLIG